MLGREGYAHEERIIDSSEHVMIGTSTILTAAHCMST